MQATDVTIRAGQRAARLGRFAAVLILVLGLAAMAGTSPASALSPNENFIRKAYADFKFRSPTANEVTWWTTYLSGSGTRQAVVTNLLNDAEFKEIWVAGVDYKYFGYYDSTSTLADDQLSDLISSGNFLETEIQAVESATYYAEAGPTNELFVQEAFRDLLMREADPSGLAYWVNRLNLGTSTRRSFAITLARSNESASRRVDGLASQTNCSATSLEDDPSVAAGSYCIILDRLADPSGFSYWTGQLTASGQLPSLWANLAGSTEYFNLAQV